MAARRASRFLSVVSILAAAAATACRSTDDVGGPSPPGAAPGAPVAAQATTERPAWLDAPVESHGARQVQRMLTDRPHMALHVRPGDELWNWAARAFEGTSLGFPVSWNPDLPSAAEADHRIPYGGEEAFVRILPAKAAAQEAFETEWCGFVYEIHNLMNAADFIAVYEAALDGHVSRPEWMRRTTELEFRAIQRTRQFFREWWDPWCGRNGLPRTPRAWFIGCGETYEEWISRYKDPAGYPESHWGRYYDVAVLTYLAARERIEEAGKQAQPAK